jgi:DNA-binding PadR family transcriptional regulator
MIRYALLALLRERSDYGYQLKNRFERLVGPSWRLNIGQVYQTLHILEARGEVAEARGADADHALLPYPQRSRRLLEVTQKGIQALDRWLARPATAIHPMRDETMVRLFALELHRREGLPPLLKARERLYRRHLSRLLAFQERLERDDASSRLARRLAIAGQILQTQAYLDWLGLCESTLADDEQPAESRRRRVAVRRAGA